MLASFHTNGKVEAGCDEAGRGCLAGPVIAGAVILPADYNNDLITDSKKLSAKQRLSLRPIIEKDAIAWGIGIASNEEIDEINILNASFLAMHRALNELYKLPESILIDGNRFAKYKDIDHHCIVKGDSKFLSIAAASILAKTYRDDLMIAFDLDYPEYDWKNNKGYPTKKHRRAIATFGATNHHRKTYQLLPSQLKLDI